MSRHTGSPCLLLVGQMYVTHMVLDSISSRHTAQQAALHAFLRLTGTPLLFSSQYELLCRYAWQCLMK